MGCRVLRGSLRPPGLPDARTAGICVPVEVSISIGETVSLAVNPDRLYYFDPDTGDAIS
jgi:hypothetical protein